MIIDVQPKDKLVKNMERTSSLKKTEQECWKPAGRTRRKELQDAVRGISDSSISAWKLQKLIWK